MYSQQEKWDKRFLSLAALISTWSKDNKKKVGAVIVRPDRSIVSTGFNGFPKKCNDTIEIYNDRDKKLQRIIHAEVNAILLSHTDLTGCTMYVYPPAIGPSCSHCATNIIQAGISRIVYYKEEDPNWTSKWTVPALLGLELFKQAGVQVTSYNYKEFI